MSEARARVGALACGAAAPSLAALRSSCGALHERLRTRDGCDRRAPATAALLTLDTHIDIPLDFATATIDPLTADLQVNLTKMAAGGLDAGFFIVFVGQTARTDDRLRAGASRRADEVRARSTAWPSSSIPDRIEIAYRAADVARIAAAGKLVAAIGVENGYSLGRDLELLDRYYELGARYIGLVHDGDNDLARSARPSAELGDPAESDSRRQRRSAPRRSRA